MKKEKSITLVKHKTSGGATYLTDNHSFAKAKLIIRIDDRETTVEKCEYK